MPKIKNSKKTFLVVAENIRSGYDFPPQMFNMRDSSPLTNIIPNYNLSIGIGEKKYETIPIALKAFALNHIMNNYPSDLWLHIYTDGSADLNNNSGAGFLCQNVFEGSCSEKVNASNFEAEIEVF